MVTPIKITKLAKGEVTLYEFEGYKLHSYATGDPLGDVVAVLECAGTGVLIENPSFLDSETEFADYLKNAGVTLAAKILSYHFAGANFMPGLRIYSTPKAVDYATHGAGAAMAAEFTKNFPGAFDSELDKITNSITVGPLVVERTKFNLVETPDAFDLAAPAIGLYYTHMLGGDTHSIIPNAESIDESVAYLENLLDRGYEMFISAHHKPEDKAAVRAKIDYLKRIKETIPTVATGDEFVEKVKAAFPDYLGEEYLTMTAKNLYPNG